jgi:hypothetical protein
MLKTKIKNYLSWQRMLALFALGIMIGLSHVGPLSAQAVTEGYASDVPLQRGMIVRIKQDDPTKLEPVTTDSSDQMHGVVVNSNDAPVSIANDGQGVFVATTGQYEVFVNTQNGPVNPGDYIAVSAISAVGMAAGDTEMYVIGRALTAFDGSKDVISTSELTDSKGQKQQVSIGKVQIAIGVARNPLLKGEDPNVPEFLRKATEAIAGKPVDAVRIYVGILIFGITTFISSSLMYGGIRSGIISIGRNPLGKKSIIRGMLQVIITGIIVFVIGVFGVYLILRL